MEEVIEQILTEDSGKQIKSITFLRVEYNDKVVKETKIKKVEKGIKNIKAYSPNKDENRILQGRVEETYP